MHERKALCVAHSHKDLSIAENAIKTCHNIDCETRVADTNNNKVCARCKVAYYCSKRCQKTHWKRDEGGHRDECKKAIRVSHRIKNRFFRLPPLPLNYSKYTQGVTINYGFIMYYCFQRLAELRNIRASRRCKKKVLKQMQEIHHDKAQVIFRSFKDVKAYLLLRRYFECMDNRIIDSRKSENYLRCAFYRNRNLIAVNSSPVDIILGHGKLSKSKKRPLHVGSNKNKQVKICQ